MIFALISPLDSSKLDDGAIFIFHFWKRKHWAGFEGLGYFFCPLRFQYESTKVDD